MSQFLLQRGFSVRLLDAGKSAGGDIKRNGLSDTNPVNTG